ncbi:peptidylprolyl isomerase [Candidatus Tenderia electrophaga]|jgi:FKBP-type peptidyl-prolyl cis-trans isomerase SlyD|uniref:Peptidyl-prolyl cis-trans isomerase n=1 Tax=Candidatus Tenderia electrophaga TaxID=1748243 RepID=A0A0S2TD75_9GAMM|nr:peptidylprolyl isomerase [Candidatus Tenderia electrophaga]
MLIEKDAVVRFHYRVSEPGQGTLEDTRSSGVPLAYLHGHGGMLPGLEAALEGKQPGDTLTTTLTPDQGYGERREGAITRVPVSHVLGHGKKSRYRPGMIVHVNSRHGSQPVRVVKAGLKNIDVDMNHPYAGKTLSFDIEVVSVRQARPEEIEHGHAHGEGGVHH